MPSYNISPFNDHINSKEGKETMKKFEEYLRKQSNKRGGRK